MKGDPCKVCGSQVDLPTGKLCRKCHNAYIKALPSYQKYYQSKAWKNRPSYQKFIQDKAWKNKPSYQKNLQKKAWKNRPSYQKRLQEKTWYTYPKTCEACGAAYKAINKYSRLCPVCYARQIELKTASNTCDQYKRITIDGRQIKEHRYLAGQVFGRAPTPDEHIHHLDENPKHNELSNLIVLSHGNHIRLHHYLEVQQVIEEKQGNPKPWSKLVVPLSLQWLHENKVPHFQLSELKAYKDQLFKQSKIASQPDLVQHLLEEKISWYLYPGSFKITAKIPEGLFKIDGD